MNLSGDPKIFENGKELKCEVIGFGKTENQDKAAGTEGYITNALVKFGPKACELSYTYCIFYN